MNCIYCNKIMVGNNKTNEHIIPQWIIKKLDIKDYKHSFKPISKDLIVHKERNPVTHTLTHKICGSCNNGWLSEIDNSCIELLSYMVEGNSNSLPHQLYKENIEKLWILIYKIFLNFFATGPQSFKVQKTKNYHDFYEKRIPPNNVELFISNVCTNSKICLNHIDVWIYENEYHLECTEEYGIKFKFYIQLGQVAFILCSTGEKYKDIVYDPLYLTPLKISHPLLPFNSNLSDTCPAPYLDTIFNRILIHSISALKVTQP